MSRQSSVTDTDMGIGGWLYGTENRHRCRRRQVVQNGVYCGVDATAVTPKFLDGLKVYPAIRSSCHSH